MEPCWRGEHGVQGDVSEDRDAQNHDDGFLDAPDGWRIIGGDHLVRGKSPGSPGCKRPSRWLKSNARKSSFVRPCRFSPAGIDP